VLPVNVMLDSRQCTRLGKEFGRVHAASASCGTGTTTFGIGDEFELATRAVGIEAVGSGAWAQGATEQKLERERCYADRLGRSEVSELRIEPVIRWRARVGASWIGNAYERAKP
jgi:hypothetical protein